MGQHRPARSCQAQHRRAGTTSAAAQRLPSEAGRPGQGKLSAPGPTGGGGRVAPGRGRETECPARGGEAELPGLWAGCREPWGCGREVGNPGLRRGAKYHWPAGGKQSASALGREAESPRASPAMGHLRHREPRRAIRLGAHRNERCAPRSGGVTRHGDRLDKAGQPGGPVSAVYSPAAACAARRSQRLSAPALSQRLSAQVLPAPLGGGALSR